MKITYSDIGLCIHILYSNVGISNRERSDGYNSKFLWKRFTCWIFCWPDVADTAVIDLNDIVLRLPHPEFSGISRRRVNVTVGMDLSGYTVK
jgi:hypothetical protein